VRICPPVLHDLVQKVQERTASPDFDCLHRLGLVTHPIPFFGDISTAQVLTVGVNPSADEFVENEWPKQQMTADQLGVRCREYFLNETSHPWFTGWERALVHLRASYRNGSAAHIDLSPRATESMGGLVERGLGHRFIELIEHDLSLFFDVLKECKKAKLILLAGSITGQWYANELLQKLAPYHGFQLEGRFSQADQRGRGKVCMHRLTGKKFDLPVFFCSSSPSDKNGCLLEARVSQHAPELVRYL
jgi:hypothetical protein